VRTMYTSWEGENGLYMKIYKWSISGEVMSIDIAALNLKVQNIDISFLYADIEKMEFGFSWRFGTSVQAIVGTKFRIYMENGTSLQAVVDEHNECSAALFKHLPDNWRVGTGV
jgi:hypothetical protein